jgi:hypothetical protein
LGHAQLVVGLDYESVHGTESIEVYRAVDKKVETKMNIVRSNCANSEKSPEESRNIHALD